MINAVMVGLGWWKHSIESVKDKSEKIKIMVHVQRIVINIQLT